jgi:DNA-binding NtrC family response regulator
MTVAKIIVIDDEVEICNILKSFFEPRGYIVKTETDPVKGLELVKSERPDCVLLDIKMPKMNGMEVLPAIRSFDKNIEVIIISAFGTVENAMKSLSLDAFDCITKPFDLNIVGNVVRRCLEAKGK